MAETERERFVSFGATHRVEVVDIAPDFDDRFVAMLTVSSMIGTGQALLTPAERDGLIEWLEAGRAASRPADADRES
jgi:hypothetical protein